MILSFMENNKNISIGVLFVFVFLIISVLFNFFINFVLPAVLSLWFANILYYSITKRSFTLNINKKI
jgi:lipopolysaccharide export LptBFGC system permease protein LptF